MEPRIQYAKTSDGVNIAFWTLGEGPPLIMMPRLPWSHTQAEWQIPPIRLLYEGLARNKRLVRYDGRGTGLSDRDVSTYSLDTLTLDLEAVVERLALNTFDLVGIHHSGPAAVAYAADHAERVSRLILWSTWVRASDYSPPRQVRAIEPLSEVEWELFTETSAHFFLGWPTGDLAGHLAMFMRECVSPEARRAFHDAMQDFNVADLLAQVKAPTLVLQESQSPVLDLSVAKGIASGIPDARLAVLDAVELANIEAAGAVINEFLSEGEETPAPLPAGMTAILFADIAESTALTERLGDAAFREKARALDGALRGVIREHGGTCIEAKTLGDGVLSVFTSARQAIEAALACAGAGSHAGLPLHLGLHAGDVIREEGNVYGGAVNIAARVSALAAPGEVLVSETVRSLARTSAGVSFEDRGGRELKGVGESMRVWAVRAGESA